ncbi:predicted protein [Lichtheimia corymbifera JMRC:FSU:9682]|uniref:Secreted protein n=1 Tax=Lichtheimia corymbifera JMRC:FSU:9682 TaxID=1263082 RepID=A0A068RVW7_9FUNG|nr:predicted protein [Lichtheimia corymbifera JMRC:FSU:9682]
MVVVAKVISSLLYFVLLCRSTLGVKGVKIHAQRRGLVWLLFRLDYTTPWFPVSVTNSNGFHVYEKEFSLNQFSFEHHHQLAPFGWQFDTISA